MKEFILDMRKKTEEFKKKRGVLADLNAEGVVLSRTEAILKSQLTDIKAYLDDLEKKKGVSGYQETQEQLENVSSKQSALNLAKGKTLEEISVIVTKMNQTLQIK